MARRRTAQEIVALVAQYQASGVTQEQYCQQTGVAKSTLTRYLRREEKDQQLVRVKVDTSEPAESGFVLVLANGRGIESSWRFGEASLARLIRVAEAV